jgi:predicted SAM-dependent methyltransferase
LNLFDMLRRRDANLLAQGRVVLGKRNQDGEVWRGLYLHRDSSFRIKDARQFASLRAFPESCGWMVDAPEGAAVRVSIVDPEGEVLGSCTLEGSATRVPIPWPQYLPGSVDLLVERIGETNEPVFFSVHRALSRQWLFDAAIGKGIEIGPGPQPQILPDERRDVAYLEQMPPEEWNRLYNAGGKYPVRPDLWQNYVVGDASSLPVPDQSLDFVFGSHVFEHLANPLGHLERWRAKLKPRGKILCVVPDLAGTKDAVQERSSLAEWLEEFEHGTWQPTERHYSRHMRREPTDKSVVAAMDRHESIHAHYYDNLNCRDLLDYAVRHLNYADYLIKHTPNHKDFHFVLQNS